MNGFKIRMTIPYICTYCGWVPGGSNDYDRLNEFHVLYNEIPGSTQKFYANAQKVGGGSFESQE